MTTTSLARYATSHGYMSEKSQKDYIKSAIERGILPQNADSIAEVVSLTAPDDPDEPIQFWQLYSILGKRPIVRIVRDFYTRVYQDEAWFTSVFENVGPMYHHVNTQAAMWIDVMGGGPFYHGAEYRLSLHHTHNALQLMNDKGAQRWSELMRKTLDSPYDFMETDPRIRISINTFLAHFMVKYAREFDFENRSYFGNTNGPYVRG
ncbi:hypothetical protein GCM10007939_24350 [Amylibacter marinus]|uniref:Globin n=1 Tax=Amylibacter marinus TaxID=1475483 RepID=A0ABQ5VXI6_9RHOB|nr:hypothetical protein [Amylibacter marinus]GLQ36151.1 hypothetical protein GCM10007939_24350 [Amylibacter marinus]